MQSTLSAIIRKLRGIVNRVDFLLCKKSRQSSQLPNTYLTSLLNANYEGLHIYWTDKEHRVLLSNATQAHFFNAKTPQEIIGKSITQICETLPIDPNMVQKLCDNNKQIMDENKPILFEEQFQHRTYLSYKAPFYDEHGKMQGILGVSTDITPQKNLQQLLEASKYATDLYLESILKSSSNNIYWVDTESRVIGCNDQQAKIMGFNNRMDLIGKNIFDVGKMLNWHPDLAQKVREHDLKILQTGKASITEETGFFNGKNHHYLSSKSPMFNDAGEVIGVLGISTDITRQKQIELELETARQKAENASRYKTEFIANISHDIRTPLVGISGLGGWLLENVPAEFKPDILSMVNASNELLALLNNVINLTKLESDEHHQKVIETFDLYELILRMTQLFTPLVTYKNLTLNLIYPELIPRRFRSMPNLIQRILLNLISNALKFTSQGEVTIRITRDNDILTVNPEDFPLLLIVEDTGIGIPESKYDVVFEEFHRLNPAYQGQYRGSGLGLSIVKKFVENLGGKVWVTSELGKGSRFFVRLPLTRSKEAGAALTTDSEIEDDLKICLTQYINP